MRPPVRVKTELRTLRNTLGIHTEGETLYGRDTSKPKARGGISPAVGLPRYVPYTPALLATHPAGDVQCRLFPPQNKGKNREQELGLQANYIWPPFWYTLAIFGYITPGSQAVRI